MEGLAFIGGCVVIFLCCIVLREFIKFIQRVVVGKYKIKCICKHEYIPYMKFYSGEHGIDYTFKCRKCDKQKDIKTYQHSNKESVF